MKHVFMPDIASLKKMQETGADIYSYILIKTIETLIVGGVNYSHKEILNPDHTYQYLLQDPDIVIPICRLYPELIVEFSYAQNDPGLCLDILTKDVNSNSCQLDNLTYFTKETTCENAQIVKFVVNALMEELIKNPKYRFTYHDPYRISGSIFDDIFSTEILNSNVYRFIFNSTEKENILHKLAMIDPFYAIMLNDEILNANKTYYSTLALTQHSLLQESMKVYKERYGIKSEGEQVDLDSPSLKVKRYLKTINKDNLLKY